jgi:S-DNA-T family DNA segregation ATPase FtsK/SpoIIIE
VSKTQNTSIKRIFIVVDECAMLTDSGVGKEAKQISAQIVDKLSTIARMGRAVGIHLIIATQRPDANAVPGSIKSNLDCRICGKADTILSGIILGDGRADDIIPKDSQGLFVMANGAEDIIFKGFLYW